MNYFPPKDIVRTSLETSLAKCRMSGANLLGLSILAGAYIAFAAEGSTMAMHDIASVGLSRFIAGVVFSTGLMLVVICGAELFTGNVLIVIGVLDRKISVKVMLKNWLWVFTGNFIGSVLLAVLMHTSGLWSVNQHLHGAYALKIAVAKVNLSYGEAFSRAILCNWLVCLAVWMAMAAKDTTGKIWGIFFPIMLFITSAFEHSVANMYYLTAGLLAKTSPAIVAASQLGARAASLTIRTALVNNLLPVTLGNIVGGGMFVGAWYWFCFKRSEKDSE